MYLVHASGVLQLVDRVVDTLRQVVVHPDGRRERLTTREAELLGYLAAREGQIVRRETLLEEIWSHRTHRSRAVDATLVRLRRKIERDPRAPVHLITIPRQGLRFLGHVRQPLARLHANLGVAATRFYGRQEELEALEAELHASRLVTLLGAGGVGKTRLATQHGARRSEGQVWLCELAAARTADAMVREVAGVLGVAFTPRTPAAKRVEILGRSLAERGPALLILDNLEHLRVAACQLIPRWLAAAPALRILGTSRQLLGLPGETRVDVDALDEVSATALFMDRAAAAGARVHEDHASAVRALVGQLDGLPLALELAAPRCRLLTPPQILERLSERFRLLRGGRGLPRRQATLRATLDWSWALLEPEDQRALALASVFVGGFSIEAFGAVCDDPRARLESLHDRCLVRVHRVPALAAMRFGLLESVRAYALAQLAQLGLTREAQARHASYFLDLGRQLQISIQDKSRGLQGLQTLAVEQHNLGAVHAHRRELAPREAVAAVLRLNTLFIAWGADAEQRAMLDDAVELAAGHARHLLPMALNSRALLKRARGDTVQAMLDLERMLAVTRSTADRLEGLALHHLGILQAEQGQLDTAQSTFTESVLSFRAHDLPLQEAGAIGALAALHTMRGTTWDGRAEALIRRALALHQTSGDPLQEAASALNLAALLVDHQRYDEAEEHLVRATDLYHATDSSWRSATVQVIRSHIWASSDAPQRAIAALQKARVQLERHGQRRHYGHAGLTLGALTLHRPDRALILFDETLAIAQTMDDRWTRWVAEVHRAAALGRLGRVDEALSALGVARRGCAETGSSALGLIPVGEAFLDEARGPRACSPTRRARTPRAMVARLLEAQLGRDPADVSG